MILKRVRAEDHCRLWEVSAGHETWRVVEVEAGDRCDKGQERRCGLVCAGLNQ